jgi:hypothetical protein
MSVELRGIDAGELAEFIRAETPAWGNRVTDAGLAHHAAILEPERVTVCVDGGRFVGGAAILTRQLTVPGERQLPMAAVTWVIRPPHPPPSGPDAPARHRPAREAARRR